MAPGPKKKNFSRRGDNIQDKDTKKVKTNSEYEKNEKKDSSPLNTTETCSDSQDRKYSKRTVTSNWGKYEEPISDPHADTMRGKDFEVLSSYSGGSESQLQLQDEKDWDEAINDKSITIDLQELISAVKSIPFHQRINVPEDIFDDAQLSKFKSVAKNCKLSHTSKIDEPPTLKKNTILENKLKAPECLDADLNVIESYESEDSVDVSSKHFTLEEKTENIIESLTFCLKNAALEKVEDSSIKIENSSSAPDDLDFLLSLSATAKNLKVEATSNNQKQTNVDDWLNSILDD